MDVTLPSVELKDLYVGHSNFTLGPINQRLSAGDFVLVRGSNGSGKTTLLSTIAGLVPPKGGRVMAGGRESTYAFLTGQTQIAFVPDDPSIVVGNMTAYEFWSSVAYLARRSRGAPSETEGARVRWQEVLQFSPPRNARISAFSHGMVKKTQLIAGLQLCREVLVLDEPSNGLDQASWQQLLGELAETRLDRITVVSSHEDKVLGLRGLRQVWDIDSWRQSQLV